MLLARLLGRTIDLCYVRAAAGWVSLTVFRYGVCGALNMALDTLLYYVLYHYVIGGRFIDLGVVAVSPHIAALGLVFPITFFNGFWLNRYVAFRSTELRTHTQLVRYFISVLGALAVNYVCMKMFVEWLHLWATPSKMITTVVSVVYSYMAARYFTFRIDPGAHLADGPADRG